MKRSTRGYSLIEMAVVLILVSLLGAVVSVGYGQIRDRANQAVSERNLELVELSQRAFYDRTGNWTKDPGVLNGLREVSATVGPSTGPSIVSISADWQRNLWLAVLDESGQCRFRMVPAPDTGDDVVDSTSPLTCSASTFSSMADAG